jgi:hypothetical protein
MCVVQFPNFSLKMLLPILALFNVHVSMGRLGNRICFAYVYLCMCMNIRVCTFLDIIISSLHFIIIFAVRKNAKEDNIALYSTHTIAFPCVCTVFIIQIVKETRKNYM